ncbi:protein OCTOPUS-like [Silene latifolia]|uniref:protein OCTOPUS-like n=1 Tax=Silene latifolia TaxID=37657 RepID=UPI003D7892CC
MNQITTEEQQLPPPPQPPQPNRNSTSCDRHPDEVFTGFCPSCLCERLVVLDSQCAGSSGTNPGRKSASAALKSLFRHGNGNERGRVSTTSFLPELRRTKSFSGDGGGFLGFHGGVEPQRKSCDVRGRSTLFSLFNQEITGNIVNNNNKYGEGNSGIGNAIEFDCETGDHVTEVDAEPANIDVSTVDEVEEEEEEESEIQVVKDEEIRVENVASDRCIDFKTMKDYIEIDTTEKKSNGGGTGKDLKEKTGSFWSAASVFSKKLKAWTKKNHKSKKGNRNRVELMTVNGKKGNAGRNCRDTQSEIADYGFGRRSCDTDPRFSLDAGRFSVDVVGPGRYSVDAGRMSFDDPRGSFDEPRASWDGYLIGGGRAGLGVSRMVPPLVSLVEDAPVVGVGVLRNDMQIPVDEPRRSSVSTIGGGDECVGGGVPGGAAQTKDYYSDSSSKRRKSLDRSSSIRKTAAAVVAEMDNVKVVQPMTQPLPLPSCVDYLNGGGGGGGGGGIRDNYSESFDLGLGYRENGNGGGGGGDRKGCKKARKWRAWNIWSLLYRRSGTSKDEDDDKYSRSNGVGRSLSESWSYGYGGGRSVGRSNSSVSWRNSYNIGSSSIRQGGSIEVNGRKKRDEFVLERNRSARYSPKHGGGGGGDNNNGMLRFYLTPMRGSRRGGSGKPKPAYSHSFARNMLRLY